jgi:hypothetical protein
MRSHSIEHRQTPEVLHPLPLDLPGRIRTNAATIYSGYAPSRDVSQYPPNQIAPLETWIDEHPPGTPIIIRYDPTNHNRVLLTSNYMPPVGGPKTPSNIKLLTVVAASFILGLMIVKFTRPQAGTFQQYMNSRRQMSASWQLARRIPTGQIP